MNAYTCGSPKPLAFLTLGREKLIKDLPHHLRRDALTAVLDANSNVGARYIKRPVEPVVLSTIGLKAVVIRMGDVWHDTVSG